MAARVASQSQSAFHGARPFNPQTDLSAVAHMLEEAFRSEGSFPFSASPILREIGVFLWTLNYSPAFPEALEGFVWVEDGQVVGNVTLSSDRSRSDRYYISNVAVKPNYRRQGIARALMHVTLDHIRSQHGHSIFLNVRPNNVGAIKLYQDLGFKTLETRGEWTRASVPPKPSQPAESALQNLYSFSSHIISDLVNAATPLNVQPYRPQQKDWLLSWDERLAEGFGNLLIGKTTRRWGLARAGRLAAILAIHAHRIGSPHHIAILVHPDFSGMVEDELLKAAFSYLDHFPIREIRAEATTLHSELIAALERQGFRFLNGLTLMQLDL